MPAVVVPIVVTGRVDVGEPDVALITRAELMQVDLGVRGVLTPWCGSKAERELAVARVRRAAERVLAGVVQVVDNRCEAVRDVFVSADGDVVAGARVDPLYRRFSAACGVGELLDGAVCV